MSEEKSFERLCHAVLESTASEVELDQFRQLLRQDPAARKAYEQQVRIHALLTWQQGRAALPAPVVLAPIEFQTQPNVIPFPLDRLLPLRRTALAMAAALVMILGFAFWHLSSRDHGGVVEVAQKGVWVEILAASDSPYEVGQRVSLKKLELASGSLRFRISSGAVVAVAGPSSLEFLSPMRLRLLYGDLVADVGTEAKGFVVETKTAHILDLGTRFSVSVGAEDLTDVAVLQGEVEVYPADKPMQPETRLASLVEGEAVSVDRLFRLRRRTAVEVGLDSMVVHKRDLPSSSVILNVTDNIAAADFWGTYHILPGAMGEGVRTYLKQGQLTNLRWRSMPNQPFPEELIGADVIGTFARTRAQLEQEPKDISIDLMRPCAVYILYDVRAPMRKWLQRDFKDTGLRVRSGPWRPDAPQVKGIESDAADGGYYVVYSVWRQDVPAEGRIKIGAQFANEANKSYSGFGIAIKAIAVNDGH